MVVKYFCPSPLRPRQSEIGGSAVGDGALGRTLRLRDSDLLIIDTMKGQAQSQRQQKLGYLTYCLTFYDVWKEVGRRLLEVRKGLVRRARGHYREGLTNSIGPHANRRI